MAQSISTEDANTVIRVLGMRICTSSLQWTYPFTEHIMAHGLAGLPMEKGNRIRILAKDIGAGRYHKPGVPIKLFSRCYIWCISPFHVCRTLI